MGKKGIQIKIEGQEKLNRLARNATKVNIKSITDGVLLKAVYLVERYAKKITPVDTGFLRSSIRLIDSRKGFKRLGPNADYAVAVHEGLGSNRSYGKRPFMEWGVKDSQNEMNALIKKTGVKIKFEIEKGV